MVRYMNRPGGKVWLSCVVVQRGKIPTEADMTVGHRPVTSKPLMWSQQERLALHILLGKYR